MNGYEAMRREDGMAEARRWIGAVMYFGKHPALTIEWRASSKRPGEQYGHVVEPRPTRVERVIEVVHFEVGVLLTPADVEMAARSMTPPMRVRPGVDGAVVDWEAGR